MVSVTDWERGWKVGDDPLWDRVNILPDDQLSPDFVAGMRAARQEIMERGAWVAAHLAKESKKRSAKRLRAYRRQQRVASLRRLLGMREVPA